MGSKGLAKQRAYVEEQVRSGKMAAKDAYNALGGGRFTAGEFETMEAKAKAQGVGQWSGLSAADRAAAANYQSWSGGNSTPSKSDQRARAAGVDPREYASVGGDMNALAARRKAEAQPLSRANPGQQYRVDDGDANNFIDPRVPTVLRYRLSEANPDGSYRTPAPETLPSRYRLSEANPDGSYRTPAIDPAAQPRPGFASLEAEREQLTRAANEYGGAVMEQNLPRILEINKQLNAQDATQLGGVANFGFKNAPSEGGGGFWDTFGQEYGPNNPVGMAHQGGGYVPTAADVAKDPGALDQFYRDEARNAAASGESVFDPSSHSRSGMGSVGGPVGGSILGTNEAGMVATGAAGAGGAAAAGAGAAGAAGAGAAGAAGAFTGSALVPAVLAAGGLVGAGANILTGNAEADAARYAADQQFKTAEEQRKLLKEMYDRGLALDSEMYNNARTDMEPYRVAGTNALAGLTTFDRDNAMPEVAAPFVFNNDDPSYAFRFNEGRKALENQAAARGGLMSGNTGKALVNYGQQAASQEYGNAFNRHQQQTGNRFNQQAANRGMKLNAMQSLAGVGQSAVQQMSNAGQNYANNASNAGQNYANNAGNSMMAGAQARGQGATGAAAARSSGYGGAINALNSALGSAINYGNQTENRNAMMKLYGGY